MAGETPDRSEQRKASSAGTASSVGDPRLSVRGEGGGGTVPRPGGRAPAPDQPTAVFRVPRGADEPAPERSAEPSDGADAPSAPPEGAAEGPERPTDAPDAPDSTPDTSDAAPAREDAPAPSAPDADPAGSGPVPVAADAETAETDPVAAAGNAPTEELPPPPADADAKTPVPADAPADPSADAPADKDARLREAVAAWVATTDPDEAPASGADAERDTPATDEDAPADKAGAADEGERPERETSSDTAAPADAGPTAPAAREPEDTPPTADGEPVAEVDEQPADAPGGAEGESDAAAEAKDSATEGKAADAAAEDGRGEPKDGPEDAPPAAASDADARDRASADDGVRDGAAESAAEDGRGEPEDGPEDALPAAASDADARDRASADDGVRGGAADAAADGDGDADADVKVDQPTGVFRVGAARKEADRREEPDQRTAVFRAVKAPPEADVERTSTFVPLRGPDERKAEPARPKKPAPEKSVAPERPAALGEAAPAKAPVPDAEHTRTQPVPPRPPLDLLAELTNTPPPPETPTRTVVRRIKVWTPLLVLLLIVFAIVQAVRPLPAPELALTSDASYTFDGDDLRLPWPGQGQSAVSVEGVGSLGTEGKQEPKAIASVAKVMTAYVILKEHPLKGDEPGPAIEVDAQAEKESASADESTAKLEEGQKFSEQQMLQLLLIPSGNNVARLLARWDAGDTKSFVAKMNAAADDLGMKNTTYTDPSGLEKETVSTAEDQLKLAAAVMKNDVFRKIVDMPDTDVEGIDGKIYNNNTLLLRPGVSGIKTGSSTPAGGNLMWSAQTEVDGKPRRILGVVMNQQAGSGIVYESLQLSLDNSYKLIQAAQAGVTSATVVKKGTVVGHVDDGLGGQTPVVTTKDLKAVGWGGLKVDLRLTDGGETVPHSADAGTVVGSLAAGTGPGRTAVPVALQSDLTEPGFTDKLTRVG
ncbi:D-alanyl-D-alanine carboxypeptidase [Streptomyces sp. NPDC060194]|uniref:D-alanyl-D-alanine carboxypeptidase n=1 Tax=Streptomyces sp. NPDC060194 TaxID=3347069 RepID=UPI003667B375